MYELECPDCKELNTVDSEVTDREWVCDHCGGHAYSSFPTDEEGNLL